MIHPRNPYRRDKLATGQVCYVHEGRDDMDPIIYRCEVCREPFLHYLVGDQIWKSIHESLWDKVICQSCFLSARYVARATRLGLKAKGPLNKSEILSKLEKYAPNRKTVREIREIIEREGDLSSPLIIKAHSVSYQICHLSTRGTTPNLSWREVG